MNFNVQSSRGLFPYASSPSKSLLVVLCVSQAIIVAKDSSLLGHPEEKSIPLDADHHSVCKYADRKDVNYRSVVSILKTVISKYVNEGRSPKSTSYFASRNKLTFDCS